jgi:hypothetical protein
MHKMAVSLLDKLTGYARELVVPSCGNLQGDPLESGGGDDHILKIPRIRRIGTKVSNSPTMNPRLNQNA